MGAAGTQASALAYNGSIPGGDTQATEEWNEPGKITQEFDLS